MQKLAETNRLSESQLQAIVTLLITKGEEWGTDSEQFRQLVETILSKRGDELTVADLTSGRLQATFELYHRRLKRKLQEASA